MVNPGRNTEEIPITPKALRNEFPQRRCGARDAILEAIGRPWLGHSHHIGRASFTLK
jgi:hypothetical protein